MTDSRAIALNILDDIFFRKRSLDEALAGAAKALEELESRDRAFVRLLVSVVLKRAPQIDVVLAEYLHEPLSALKPANLLNVLRLGVAQLVFLQTPPHAAVDTSVNLVEHQKPLVNAVLRRVTREGFPELDARAAGKLNTPGWLWNQWVDAYGDDTTLDICAAHLGEAPLDITVKSDPALWAEKLDAEVLPTGSLRREAGGFIPDMPGFAEGAWWIQNAAAAIPATLFGDLHGKTVIDLCAAPGGKTAQLAAAGAQVTALDRSAPRLVRLTENMARLKLEVESVAADGTTWQPPAPVDAVLLDAPCTATGTIRHQPDVLRLKGPKDQEKLVILQRRLLANAATMLKPGGLLVYCTCSLQRAEGEAQTDWVLQNLPLKLDPISGPNIPGVTPRGEVRLLPQAGGFDGFYIARFRIVM